MTRAGGSVVTTRIEASARRRVPLVEDEALIRMDIAHELSLAGLSVLEAASGEEAMDILEAGHRVDVVFSDVQLGGAIDGIALARRLRALSPAPPVILTSALDLGELPPDIEGALENGSLRFLPKPYRPATVMALVGEVGGKA